MNTFYQIVRNLHKIEISKLVYKNYGVPVKVLEHQKEDFEFTLGSREVLVKMLAAPINPQDINIIEGRYPNHPGLPSIPGNEGVGQIVQVGNEVKTLKVGDKVVPLKSHTGTWRTHFLSYPEHLLKIPKDLGLVEAATLSVNPCTAYRLIHDFVSLCPEDSLIQNGANSAVGQNVIQLGKIMKIKTINIVRNRPRIDELKQYLKDLGANYVFTNDEISKTDIFQKKVKKPRLGLNCIGGKSVLNIMRHLDKNSVLVTYGGMAKEPVMIPTGPFIFKNFKAVGFWLNEWLDDPQNEKKKKMMYEDIISLMRSGELKAPNARVIPFKQYKDALDGAFNDHGMVGRKYILRFVK